MQPLSIKMCNKPHIHSMQLFLFDALVIALLLNIVGSFFIISNPARRHLSLEIYRKKSNSVKFCQFEKCWCYFKKM